MASNVFMLILRKRRLSGELAGKAIHDLINVTIGVHEIDVVYRPTYVQQLEQRLRHVEGKLVDSNAAGDDHLRGRSRDDHQNLSSTRSRAGSEDLTAQSSVLARGRTGDQRYFGPGSVVSVLSTNGLRWIASHTRDPSIHRSLRTTLDEECRWTSWTHPMLQDIIRQDSKWPLPPWADALALVEEYFAHHHKAFPIFHPPTFMSLLSQQYSSDPIRSPGWWASLNAVLAIAQRRRNENNPSPDPADEDLPWQFARNALDVILEILMLNTSLTSVQALLALFSYFIGTPNPQPSFFFASAAVRTGHAIGLHETVNLPNISAFEREQRQSIFWCSLIADQATSFRTGRPPAHALYDTKIELPESIMGDTLEVTNSNGHVDSIDIFHFNAWMARIQSEVYYRLYSPSTTGRSEAEITMAVLELDDRLKEWRLAFPISARPGLSMAAWSNPVNIDLARLHLDYFHCVITVHRMKAYRNGGVPKTEDFDSTKPDPLQFLFSEKCVEAAKQSIEVLGIIPQRAASFFWYVSAVALTIQDAELMLPYRGATHFPLSAFVVLFINKLPHPIRDPDELRAAEILIGYVSRFSGDHIESHGHLFLAMMKELLRAARISVKADETKSDTSTSPNTQTSPDGSQPTPLSTSTTDMSNKHWQNTSGMPDRSGPLPIALSSHALQNMEQTIGTAHPSTGMPTMAGMGGYSMGSASDQVFKT